MLRLVPNLDIDTPIYGLLKIHQNIFITIPENRYCSG
jgi:hypothetical protein